MAIRAGHDVLSLGFNYGQRAEIELDYAARLCQRLGVRRKVIEVQWQHPARIRPTGRMIDEIRKTPSSGGLPLRNTIFLALGVAEAIAEGAAELWTGLNHPDSPAYPDCQPQFLQAFAQLVAVAAPQGPRVRAPLMDLTKPRIGKLALEYGLGREEVWSCYSPTNGGSTLVRCGHCDGCVVNNHAWNG
jgi:7-cyano-7-deazaguanine synthase